MSSRSFNIEMIWYCKVVTCGARNLGRHLSCQKCGAPKEDDEYLMPEEGVEAPEVTDPELNRMAEAGPNWSCRFCKSKQRKLDGTCSRCGAGEREPVAQDSLDNPWFKEEAKKAKATYVDGPAPRAASKAAAEMFSAMSALVEAEDKANKRKVVAASAAALVGVGCVIWFLVWLFTPRVIREKLVAFHWETTTEVERKQVVADEGFDVPSQAFEVRDLGSRWHHNENVFDHYDIEYYSVSEPCGQTCVPIPRTCTKSCTSGKNGFANCQDNCTGGGQSCSTKYCSVGKSRQVAKYRSEPRYREYYAWREWRWVHNRTLHEYGSSNKDVHWPPPEKVRLNEGCAGGEEERTSSIGRYFIVLESPHKNRYDFEVQSLSDYEKYQLGKFYMVTVPKIGSVSVAEIQ